VVAERGWIDADELEILTGVRRAPLAGRWVTTPEALTTLTDGVRARIGEAGPLGLDVAVLDDRERAAVELMDDVLVAGGRARPAGAADPVAGHPLVTTLEAAGFAPPAPDPSERAAVRELVRRGVLVERDGVVFHSGAIDAAALVAARLLVAAPDGFTVAEFRDSTGATRKYAIPLLNELDARGVTRRRGDLRIGGPRLPDA